MKTFPITLPDDFHFELKMAALKRGESLHNYILESLAWAQSDDRYDNSVYNMKPHLDKLKKDADK